MFARGLLVLLALGVADHAFGQAWVPPARIGVVSVVYQTISNTNHRLTDGSLFDGYDSLSRGVLVSLDYAFTDRVSMSVGLPYIGSKYTGPEPSLFGLAVDDCFCWNHGWQDLGVTARYSLANGAFAFTPSVSFGMPTHDYDYFGEAVLGRNLNEVRVGFDVGQRLDAISERLSVSGRYTTPSLRRSSTCRTTAATSRWKPTSARRGSCRPASAWRGSARTAGSAQTK